MENYEIVLDADCPAPVAITCRAPSVFAVLRRAASILPPGRILEIRNGDRCVYKGALPEQPPH